MQTKVRKRKKNKENILLSLSLFEICLDYVFVLLVLKFEKDRLRMLNKR